jgi:CBS domain-containing protein
MQAADIMTRAVITVTPETLLLDAIQVMLLHRISGLPVVDGTNQLVGMLTEGDLLRRHELGTQEQRPHWLEFLRGPGLQAADYIREHGQVVGEIMTGDVLTVAEDTPLEDVVTLMETRRIKRVPVMAAGGLVGLVSRADMLRALSIALAQPVGAAASDGDLRAQLLAEVKKCGWADERQLAVTVTNRVATLEGLVHDVRERDALRVAVETVPGIKGYRDELRYVDPQQSPYPAS